MTNFYKNSVYSTTDSYDIKTSLNSKGLTNNRNFIVPAYSAPLLGSESNGEQGTAFKARPIKHWRKQLNPRLDTDGKALSGVNGRRAGLVGYMGVPGGSTILGTTNNCGPADCILSSTILTDTILRPISDKIYPVEKGDNNFDAVNIEVSCVACNPQNNIIKSASSILSKKYYSDRKAYLQSRCLLYDQRLSGTRLTSVTYVDPETNAIILPNGTNQTELRAAKNCLNCPTNAAVSTTNVVYKPSNHQYATQGAVDSSSRIARLKYNTITKNGSLTALFGTAAANANALYNGTSDTSYFLKSKLNATPCTFTRTGSKTSACFKASLIV
jgi:hypothetical protein